MTINPPADVRRTTAEVVRRARGVRIVQDAVALVAARHPLDSPHWTARAPGGLLDVDWHSRLAIAFAFNAISFCYWGEPRWRGVRADQSSDGSWGMLLALRAALDHDPDALLPARLAQLEEEGFRRLVGEPGGLPLIPERIAILRSLGEAIMTSFAGDYSQLVERAGGDAIKMLNLVLALGRAFADSATYGGLEVFFYKRAQLLVADLGEIVARRTSQRLGREHELTGCADYKVPQVLRELGVLEYAPDLALIVDSREEMEPGCPEEVEIRAATIQSIEALASQARRTGRDVSPMMVNDCLWLMGQEASALFRPYHRVRSSAY